MNKNLADAINKAGRRETKVDVPTPAIAVDRLREKIQARIDAEVVIEIAGNQPNAFYEHLAKLCADKLPVKQTPVDSTSGPFNELQAKRFEDTTTVPYGKFKGSLVGSVPLEYLEFLAEGDEFIKDLRRYTASDYYKKLQRAENG